MGTASCVLINLKTVFFKNCFGLVILACGIFSFKNNLEFLKKYDIV